MEKRKGSMIDFIESLKQTVSDHSVLKVDWLTKREKKFTLNDLKLWLSQEYFVSIGFVNWFLIVATQTNNLNAKIVLVENIWEELGEGDITQTHVSILIEFLNKLNLNAEEVECLPETKLYLSKMEEVIKKGFYQGLGALGPANEFLLKLEYKKVFEAYQRLQASEKLPEGKFFNVNLEADEGHSKRLFDLIEKLADTEEKRNWVKEGNWEALEARKLFYEGLSRLDKDSVLVGS